MTSRISKVKISEPYENPLILAPNLNPIRTYEATAEGNGRTEKLTGVIFADQKPSEQIEHHAKLRGFGQSELPTAVKRMEKLR